MGKVLLLTIVILKGQHETVTIFKWIIIQKLATDETFEPLCKHPYVSAFLDIHFSSMKKIQSQLRDTVPLFTMMSLLLEATSTLEADDHEKLSKYSTVISCTILVVLLMLEAISWIGLKTEILDKIAGRHLLKETTHFRKTRFKR